MSIHKPTFFKHFVRCCQIALNDPTAFEGQDQDQVYRYMKAQAEELGKRWVDSDYTDFSVYLGDRYLPECLWSYVVNSKDALNRGVRWLKRMYPGRTFRTLDYYNGIGLTSLDVALHGWPIDVFNDVELQVQTMNRLFTEFGMFGKLGNVYSDHKFGKYDLVVCLEVLEHMHEPMPLVDLLINSCEHNSMILETTNFTSPVQAGHFPSYIIDKKIVPGRIAGLAVRARLREAGFRLTYFGWNEHPRVWVRGD